MNQSINREVTHFHQDVGDTSEFVGISELPPVVEGKSNLLTLLLAKLRFIHVEEQQSDVEHKQ